MTGLVRYDAARKALAEACRVDEAKKIRDQAMALQEYARQAKDGDLIGWATEIRLRAERKAGELLRSMADAGERAPQGGDRKSKSQGVILKLADVGVSPMQSSRWQKLAEMASDSFERKVEAATREALSSLTATREERQAEKRARRADRERELAAKVCAWAQKRYPVVYCDPPWRLVTYSENGLDRAADNHYPTMDLDAIKALDINSIAADDCVLFMWVTGPFLAHGIDVLRCWGFEYKSRFVWDKEVHGNGYWVLDDAEELLIATRGDVPCPAMGDKKFAAMQRERKTRHSAKPERFAKIIESYFPTSPKIELNRRGAPRDGWDAWGNEAI
jgi:N6-adenosine-specific RNA methylase IME4